MAVPGPMKCFYILLFYSVIGCNDASRSFTSGKKFVSVFLQNYDNAAVLSLHIISYDQPTAVSVFVSVPAYHHSTFLNANSTIVLTLNSSYMLLGNEIAKKVITVTSSEDISLIMLNGRPKTYDSFLNLPFINLGTKYYIVTYTVNSLYNIKQFAIANSNEAAQVTITVSGLLTFNGTQYADKETFSFALEPNEAVQFQSDKDLTGTKVVSTTPVAVFSGDQCITVPPNNCDHIAEQLHPVDKWSNSFIIFPLMDKAKKDIITVVSANNDTAVNIYTDEASKQVMLQEGSHINFTVEGGTVMNSSKPVMVIYLFTGGRSPQVSTFDPFLVTVISSAYFSNDFAFVTIDHLYNYILIVSPGDSSAGIILDGRPLAAYPSENATFSDFTASRIYLGVTGGRHMISHASARFAIYIYGIGRAESYGYPMGNTMFTVKEDKWGSLTCLPKSAVYTFPYSALASAGLSVADVHLTDHTCRARQKDEDWVVITAPFDSCGTKSINETGKIVYANTVYGTPANTSIHRLKIKLNCKMSTIENITMAFVPHSHYISRLGHYNISFTMFHSATFDDPVLEFPYEIDLNRTLYIQMEADTTDSGVEIFTESCMSAPSLNSESLGYSIIENGCSKDSTFEDFPTQDPRKQRFSIHVFKFDNYQGVFVICEVMICHMNSRPNRCSQGCLPARQKRDLSTQKSQDKSARLSQGPIMFPNNLGLRLRMNSESRESKYLVPILGVLSGGCLISILVLILQRKYYQQSPAYTLLPSS